MGSERKRRATHESRIFTAALIGGLPAVAVGCWLLWTGDHPLRVRLTFSLFAVGAWLIRALVVRERVVQCEDLQRCTGLWLVNSVRGEVEARLEAGQEAVR